MNVKEKLCRDSIKIIRRKLDKLIFKMDFDHFGKWCDLHDEGVALINGCHKGDYSSILNKLNSIVKEQKKAMRLSKDQFNPAHLKKRVKLEMELSDLNHELFIIESRKL